MRASAIAAVVVALGLARAANAQSFIPGNDIDEFGPFTYSNPSANSSALKRVGHVSPIPSNNVDDFGPLVSERPVAHDEVGAAGGEPGMDTVAAERAKEKAAIGAYDREQFLRTLWAPLP